MKAIITVLVVFLTLQSRGQQHYIQTRSIANNHTEDRWEAVQTPPIVHDTIRIRDTVYVSQKFLDSLNDINYKVRYERVMFDTSYFTTMSLNWHTTYIRFPKRRYRRVRQRRNTYMAVISVGKCPLDTVSGLLIYNKGYHTTDKFDFFGNVAETGYWVGCQVDLINTSDSTSFIPSVYIENSLENESIFRLRRSGKFYNEHFKYVPRNRVYGLIIN